MKTRLRFIKERTVKETMRMVVSIILELNKSPQSEFSRSFQKV